MDPQPQKPAQPAPSKPAPAKPAPQTQEQKKTDQACQTCPALADKMCDVTKLQVRVMMLGEKSVNRSLDPLTKKLRGSPRQGKAEQRIGDLLDQYDHVIDTIAGYPSREDPSPTGYRQDPKVNKGRDDNDKDRVLHSVGDKDVVEVEALSHYTGTCSTNEHPFISFKQSQGKHSWVASKARGDFDRKTWEDIEHKGTKLEKVVLYSNSLGQDFGVAGGNLSVLFDIIRTIWPSHDPRCLEVRAISCGARGRTPQEAPNTYLNTLVRIFRKDSYQIGVKIPPLGKFEHERSGTITGLKVEQTAVETKMQGAGGVYQRNSKFEKGDDGAYSYEASRWTHNGGQGWSGSSKQGLPGTTEKTTSDWNSKDGGRTYSETRGNFTGNVYQSNSELFDALKRAPGFQLVIKRNDREFTWAKDPNDKRSLKEKVIDGINKAVEGIQTAIDTLKKLPQVGWKFTFNISILEGALVGQWEPKLLEKTPSGRYHPVRHKLSIKISMDVFKLELDLSFGVDARALGTGIVAKVGINGGLKVTVEKEWTLNIPHDEGYSQDNAVALKPEAKFGGYAIGYASLAGWSLIDAKLSCDLVFSMPNGELSIDDKKGLMLKGTLRREPVYLRGHIKGFWGWKRMDPIEVCGGALIHKFG